MNIIKATQAIPVEHPIFTVFGQPGIGKSSICYSAKEPLLLDFDGGAHRAANRRDTAQISKWSDVEDLSEAIAGYSSIIVDTVGRCLDLMSVDITEKNPKHGYEGNLSLKGFAELKSHFRSWMTALRTMGKDIVLIAHQKEEKDGDNMIVRPDITGSSYGEIMKISDFVGFIYMSGKNRILDFSPTDRWVGKNPAGWKPLPVPPIAKATTFLAGLIDSGRASLGKISEDSMRVTILVDEWRAALDICTTADECNKSLALVLKIKEPIVAAQVKRLLMDRAKVLNFEYSAVLKAFVEKEKVTA